MMSSFSEEQLRNIGRLLRSGNYSEFYSAIRGHGESIEEFLDLIMDHKWENLFYQWFMEVKAGFKFGDFPLDEDGLDGIVASYIADGLFENEDYILSGYIYFTFRNSKKAKRKFENCREKLDKKYATAVINDDFFQKAILLAACDYYGSDAEWKNCQTSEDFQNCVDSVAPKLSAWQRVVWAVLGTDMAAAIMATVKEKDWEQLNSWQARIASAVRLETLLKQFSEEMDETPEDAEAAHIRSKAINQTAESFLHKLDGHEKNDLRYAQLAWISNIILDKFDEAAQVLKNVEPAEDMADELYLCWKKDMIWLCETVARQPHAQQRLMGLLLKWMKSRIFYVDRLKARYNLYMPALEIYYAKTILESENAIEAYYRIECSKDSFPPMARCIIALLLNKMDDVRAILDNNEFCSDDEPIVREMRIILLEKQNDWMKLEEELSKFSTQGFDHEFQFAAHGLAYGAECQDRLKAFDCLSYKTDSNDTALSFVMPKWCYNALSELSMMMVDVAGKAKIQEVQEALETIGVELSKKEKGEKSISEKLQLSDNANAVIAPDSPVEKAEKSYIRWMVISGIIGFIIIFFSIIAGH